MSNIDLLSAFDNYRSCIAVCEKVIEALKDADPAVVVLAFEGLFRIESGVNSRQFQGDVLVEVRDVLRKWRCESPLTGGYSGTWNRVPGFLRNLTIFKTLEIPLFIDDDGNKELLNEYAGSEDTPINEETTIFHATSPQEADMIIAERQLKPSDKNNIIKGTRFGLEKSSIGYGGRRFQTTLRKLGIKGLRQGEIVSYNDNLKVNVILYAEKDATEFKGLKKPTVEAVKEGNSNAYIHVSIFVPANFLPSPDKFKEVISGPNKVHHGRFCVRAKRSNENRCTELN